MSSPNLAPSSGLEHASPAVVSEPPSSDVAMPVVRPAGTASKETPSLFRRQKPEEKKEVEEQVKVENEVFTEEALQEAWKAYLELRSSNGASDMELLVLNRTVGKSGQHNVKISLVSQLEVSILERMEQDLVQYFRRELKNTFILLEKEVKEQETTRKLYTSKDKYEYMVRQNPALKEMKERLGLDFEY